MADMNTATLKQIVTDDFRTAAVFDKYSLDFCCRGGQTIEQACINKGVDTESVVADLAALLRDRPSPDSSWGELPMTDVIRHIVGIHHAYVKKIVPVLLAHARKVAAVHGANHPEVVQIASGFERVASVLQHHMAKEEQVLFPYIESLVEASHGSVPAARPPFATARNPIRMMEAEHQAAGDELYEIRRLSSHYTPPPDACTTYKVTYQELQEFERDLHQHVHLENNVVFPKAVALEEEIFARASG